MNVFETVCACLRVCADMVNWPIVSYVFPRTYQHPWAVKDFWAPVKPILFIFTFILPLSLSHTHISNR
jgi:hypothetical protein